MSAERILAPLAGVAIALILCSLVVAAFTLTAPPRSAETDASMLQPAQERTVPIARGGMERLRDLTRAEELFAPEAASAPAPVADATSQPTPEPTLEPTPVPTSAPTARPAPVVAQAPAPVPVAPPVITTSTADAEQRTLELINASRVAGGLVPLAIDPTVSSTARAHSDVESQYGYVYHDGPDGTAKARDVAACGTGWFGENTGKVWRGNVDALHVEFMSEPWEPINHRTNIMDPAFRRVGIGAVQGRDALYLTMVFCR